jgi:hypothetical protein
VALLDIVYVVCVCVCCAFRISDESIGHGACLTMLAL